MKNRKIDRSEARLDGNAFYKSVGGMNDANLPDASGDPSLLMQNIYRIRLARFRRIESKRPRKKRSKAAT